MSRPALFDASPVSVRRLEPVFIEQVRECHFKRKPNEDGHRRLGCARCGRPKADRAHMGQPPSMNPLGSGDRIVYQATKRQWQNLLIDLLFLEVVLLAQLP